MIINISEDTYVELMKEGDVYISQTSGNVFLTREEADELVKYLVEKGYGGKDG